MNEYAITPEFVFGAISLEPSKNGLRPWRIPFDQADLFNIDGGLENAKCSAGVRVRFATTARTVGLRVIGAGHYDLLYANQRLATVEKAEMEASDICFQLPVDLPAGENVLDIWLPQGGEYTVVLAILADGPIAPADDDRLKWVTYGSSITHCNAADSPARTWPGMAARMCDVNHTNLGYGGQCHLDGMVARMIRDLPADVITIKCAINTYSGSLAHRTLRPAIISTIRTIREKHPTTPMGLISPIISPPREAQKGGSGYSLQEMRVAIQDAADRLIAAGDNHLTYYDGLQQLGPQLAHLLPDELHPNGEGYVELGRTIARNVLSDLLGSPAVELEP